MIETYDGTVAKKASSSLPISEGSSRSTRTWLFSAANAWQLTAPRGPGGALMALCRNNAAETSVPKLAFFVGGALASSSSRHLDATSLP